MVENHDAYVGVSDENPFIHFTNLSPTWSSILKNSPWAFISGLFRPFIFESQTVFQAVISLENLLLIVLCFINLKNISTAWHSPHRLMILSAVVYISLLSIFLALSTPNFGTLSRYRIGFLPFLFFLLLYYPSQDIKRWINKLKQP
ncbi:MAG: hypothetical protein RIA63_03240 [Cyclobacteriaceae bacterium]